MTPDLSNRSHDAIMVFSVASSDKGGIKTGGRNQPYNLGKKKRNNTHGSLLGTYWLRVGSLLPPSWITIYLPTVILIAGLAQSPSRARMAQRGQ